MQISLLLMHEEDQLMTTELLKGMANEVILTHKKYSDK
ncbi:PTS lactose/cellobiose transporter subunit IIA [Clostridium tertium]|nr:PTS lactose/cellobiose transporter subunit IIA [Clostridium tertium]MDI9217342.1 PTS lactose/cellobiose transporter subunit IIA [Clostridium tertium]